MQGLRHRLYDVLGLCYSAVSPAPACLPLLQLSGAVTSPNGLFRCRGRVRGKGFNGKRFSVQEISANIDAADNSILDDGFDGLLVSFSHDLRVLDRTIVLPDRGPLNPRHIDGMKRVGFGSREFERKFEVYADDQVEARALVPPDFMERLLAFSPILERGQARVAFTGRQMHVVLPTGPIVQISEERSFDHIETAAAHVAEEMGQVFDIVSQVDVLQAKGDRHCPEATHRAREDYYASALSAIEPAVMAALKNGIMTNDRRAKYMTDTAWMVDEGLRGLLMPRV